MADTALQRWPSLPAVWSHEHGVLFKALIHVWHMTGDARYIDYVRAQIDRLVDGDGRIADYDIHRYSLDDLVTGRALLSLLQYTHDARYLKAVSVLRTQYPRQPRTLSGCFWHKKEMPDQVFLDGAYMAIPFYVDCARRERSDPALADAAAQLLHVVAKHRDDSTGLYCHGWDETRRQDWADADSGRSRSFWCRGTGWFAMALVDTLDLLPGSNRQRGALIEALRGLGAALLRVQDAETGLWWQVLDQGARTGNYLETSGSAMIIYALARGVRHGYLPPSMFQAPAARAFRGLLTRKMTLEEDGLLSLRDTCKSAALGLLPHRDGSFEYYVGEPLADNDMKGVAAFILAASEIERLAAQQ
ncbi:MAG: glycoside hydrolase family 88 protein [Rhodocyclaceae bacterium]